MFDTLHGFTEKGNLTTPNTRRKSTTSLWSEGEQPNFMKSTAAFEARSREPLHPRTPRKTQPHFLPIPKPKKVKKSERSASQQPVKRLDTQTMDSYKKIVQNKLKNQKEVLLNNQLKDLTHKQWIHIKKLFKTISNHAEIRLKLKTLKPITEQK